MLGEHENAPEANALFSLATLLASLVLTAQVISGGPVMGIYEQFFVDPLNVFLVTLTAFVAFTASENWRYTESLYFEPAPARMRIHTRYAVPAGALNENSTESAGDADALAVEDQALSVRRH